MASVFNWLLQETGSKVTIKTKAYQKLYICADCGSWLTAVRQLLLEILCFYDIKVSNVINSYKKVFYPNLKYLKV